VFLYRGTRREPCFLARFATMADAEIATHLTRRGVYTPTCYRWDMEKTSRLDSKGRLVIPPDLREGLGDHIVIRKTEAGIILAPGKKEDRVTEFLNILESEPERTGKPGNPGPDKIKSIWKESA
jgi:bifunctional DNA-binding transcriptional regulator/antitoxin component of YhaV-PrlF toxin-antitoxin module